VRRDYDALAPGQASTLRGQLGVGRSASFPKKQEEARHGEYFGGDAHIIGAAVQAQGWL